jgi:hypothetical protein
MSSATPIQLLAALTHWRNEGCLLEKETRLRSGMRGLEESGHPALRVRSDHLWRFITQAACTM